MIKVYVEAFVAPYEGEDIEVRYSIYEDEERVCIESAWMEYRKPLLVDQVVLLMMLKKKIVEYKGNEMTIFVNAPALLELIRGTSTTKNRDVLEMAQEVISELAKFENAVVKDVSVDRVLLREWNEALKK